MATAEPSPDAVTLSVENWLSLMDVMDNAISIAVVEGDPGDIVPVANRVRRAASASAYETNEKQLPHHQLTSVELAASDWRFALLTLAHWAEVADGMTPGIDPDGSVERALISGIVTQLPEATLGAG